MAKMLISAFSRAYHSFHPIVERGSVRSVDYSQLKAGVSQVTGKVRVIFLYIVGPLSMKNYSSVKCQEIPHL